MKKIVIFGLLGVTCVSAAVLLALRRGEGGGEDIVPRPAHEKAVRPNLNAQSPNLRPKPPKPILEPVEDDEDDERTPEEKALAERIEKALDEEDLEAALKCADEALKCGVVEICQNMVETLGWFGEKALPELTPFLADPDEDVRESAMNEWTMALSSIEDDGAKIRTVELAMGVLKDGDALEEISSEYIGVDEKMAVESLVRIIDGGGPKEGVEKAKETYEFVTGDEWTNAAEAERWIAEEYEPPAPEEP